jgi:hypothetical protein
LAVVVVKVARESCPGTVVVIVTAAPSIEIGAVIVGALTSWIVKLPAEGESGRTESVYVPTLGSVTIVELLQKLVLVIAVVAGLGPVNLSVPLLQPG